VTGDEGGSPRHSSIRARIAALPGPSRSLVGSSSRRMSGASSHRRATAMRVRSPPLNPLIVRVRSRSGRSTLASVSAMRCSNVQSASAMSSAVPSPRARRSRRARPSATPRACASDSESSGQRCASSPTRPAMPMEPDAGSPRPAISDSSVALARTVAADEADALGTDRECEAFEQGAVARRFGGDAIECDGREHGHTEAGVETDARDQAGFDSFMWRGLQGWRVCAGQGGKVNVGRAGAISQEGRARWGVLVSER